MNQNQENKDVALLVKVSYVVALSSFAVLLLVGLVVFFEVKEPNLATSRTIGRLPATASPVAAPATVPPADEMWRAPDLASLPATPEGEQIRYGRELVANTAQYLGPKGSVLHISNGMNCQNCHLEAGTKPFGNNYSLVASTFPKVRARSGMEEDVVKRVNDCFERSLNGKALPAGSKEMQAMVAYIEWVGKDVEKDEDIKGSDLMEITMLDRAASPEPGKAIYAEKCQVCHGKDGEGVKPEGNTTYVYPPLWGKNSYNDGAGLYRISNFARFVKANMPLGATYDRPQLTDQQAWDLAAYVNSMPRPKKDVTKDWPDISKKPFDHPFGPFADEYSEEQHKFGPFQPIIAAKGKDQNIH